MSEPKPTATGSANFEDGRIAIAPTDRRPLKHRERGVGEGRFVLLFEPIVSAKDERTVGAEGLVRWQNADGAIVTPGAFAERARRPDAVASLSARLLKEVCAFVRSSADAGKPVIPISLNISAAQCGKPSFALRLIAAIENHRVPPAVINVEIAESTAGPNIETMRDNLRLLKRYGVGIHIDDFGAGFSKLSLLRLLPIDALKIDRTFVLDVGKPHGSDAIIRAIVGLARKLGFATIAEGVETRPQAARLKELGVDALQGIYFSRPINQADLLERLDAERRKIGVALVA